MRWKTRPAALTYGDLLIGAQCSAQAEPLAPPGQSVGLMLPNANAARRGLFRAAFGQWAAGMLNFSAGPANVLAACKAAQVKTIVTSRAFVEKASCDNLVERIGAETRSSISKTCAKTFRPSTSSAPVSSAARRRPARPDEPAVILFTSGSEGPPKGVVLSHRNILSNVAQAAARSISAAATGCSTCCRSSIPSA